MKAVRFGVIGVGNIGTAHVNCLGSANIKDATLAAACDISPDRRAFCEQQWKVPTFEKYAAMLQSGLVDAVIVSVPHPLHAEIAAAALKAELHVLVEKPVDITVSKAHTLNVLAEKSGKVFGIMFNQRTSPLFARAREIVQGGALGELKRTAWTITNWYRTQQYYDSGSWRATWAGEGGGVLLNQAPHNLDLWQWICGMPVSVTAFCDEARYHRIEVEDSATVFTRYANGATGTFITATGEFPGTNRLEMVGDKGKMVLENGVMKWWKLQTSEREVCFSSKENAPAIPMEYTEFVPKEKETAHAGILQNFTDAVLYGEPLLAPGYDGIKELTVSNAAYLSAWTGNREIQLPFDQARFDALLAERMKQSVYHSTEGGADDPSQEYSRRWQVQW